MLRATQRTKNRGDHSEGLELFLSVVEHKAYVVVVVVDVQSGLKTPWLKEKAATPFVD